MKLTIGHLYPDLLNLYGDRGNIQCFRKRLEWRGIEAEVIPFLSGDKIDFSKLDIVLLGGGSDREQMLVCEKLKEIQKDFNELYPNVTIYYSADSSGTLQTQIEEGARCDLFFSAADKQMDALTEEKLTKEDTVVDLLENKVVLIKPADGETKVTGFENVTDAENMALAGEDVPVGQYSREIFTNLGIMDDVNKMEINECKNVTDVLAAVSEGSNEIGVVYATDAASVADKVEILAEAPADSLQTPVLYPVGLIEDKEASEDDTRAAEAFLDYVESDAAIKVFEDYGFTAYEADDTDKDADESASQDADSTEADKDSADSADSTSK